MMKTQDLFKVRVGSAQEKVDLPVLIRRWAQLEQAIEKVLAPLKIGGQLSFGEFVDDERTRWLCVMAKPAVQQALFTIEELLRLPSTQHPDKIGYELVKQALSDLQLFMNEGLWDCADVMALADRIPVGYQKLSWPKADDGFDLVVAPDGERMLFSLASPCVSDRTGPEMLIACDLIMVGTSSASIRVHRDVRRALDCVSNPIGLHWRSDRLPATSERMFICLDKVISLKVKPVLTKSNRCKAFQLVEWLGTST